MSMHMNICAHPSKRTSEYDAIMQYLSATINTQRLHRKLNFVGVGRGLLERTAFTNFIINGLSLEKLERAKMTPVYRNCSFNNGNFPNFYEDNHPTLNFCG